MTHAVEAHRTAIVCVECQNGVLGTDSVLPALAADSEALVANLARLLSGARAAGARIVHATYEGALDGQPTGTAPIWRALSRATAGWIPGSHATQVIPELFDDRDVIIPRHHGLYPTLDTELLPVLKGWGVTTVVLAGVSLNLALPFTAGHISQSGFDLVIPRDGVGATPPEYGEQVLANSLAYLGRIHSVDEITAAWSA